MQIMRGVDEINQEWPQLSATQKRIAKVRPTLINLPSSASPLTVVATVATDGGENRLCLEPIQVQVIRVADSLGEIYFEDFIAQLQAHQLIETRPDAA